MRWCFPLLALLSGLGTLRAQTPSRLANLSVLTDVGANDASFTVAFVTSGGPGDGFPVLVRAVGPELARAFNLGDAISDPRLSAYHGSRLVAANDNWGSAGPAANLPAVFGRVGAFPLSDMASKDAVLLEVMRGANSMVVTAAPGNRGKVLAELYDRRPVRTVSAQAGRLTNMSILKRVDDSLTAGFVIDGDQPKTVLIRAIGPSLGAFGVADPLPDPKLDVFRGDQRRIADNDDWGDPSRVATLRSAFTTVGAFDLPTSSRDAAVLVTLAPGAYTARVSLGSGPGGTVLFEAYDADATGLKLAQAQTAPGEVLSFVGDFPGNAKLEVVFKTSDGQRVTVPARRSEAGRLEVAAPVLFDQAGLFGAVNGVDLELVAVTSFERRTLAHVANFGQSPLPATGAAPGHVSAAYLRGLTTMARRSHSNFLAMEALLGQSTATVRTAITEQERLLSAFQAVIDDIAAGRRATVVIGTYNGTNVVLNAASLALVDQLLASYVGNAGGSSKDSALRRDALVESTLAESRLVKLRQAIDVPASLHSLTTALADSATSPLVLGATPPRDGTPPRARLLPGAIVPVVAAIAVSQALGVNLGVLDFFGRQIEGLMDEENQALNDEVQEPTFLAEPRSLPGLQITLSKPDTSRVRSLIPELKAHLAQLRERLRPVVIIEPQLASEWLYGHPQPFFTFRAKPKTASIRGKTSAELRQDISGAPTITTSATPTSPVGAYHLEVARGSLSSLRYQLHFQASEGSIEPAPLWVSAHEQVRLERTENAPFKPNYSGFAAGDTAEKALEGSPSFSTAATRDSPLGVYPVSVERNDLWAANYRFFFRDSRLEVVTDTELLRAYESHMLGTWNMRGHGDLRLHQYTVELTREGSALVGYYYDPKLAAPKRYRMRWHIERVGSQFFYHEDGYWNFPWRFMTHDPLTMPVSSFRTYWQGQPYMEFSR
jgi:hypothetical protein